MQIALKNEIASTTRDPLNPNYMGLLRQQDDTLESRGNGRGVKLYEEVERDAYAFACLHKRKMAVIARPWEVTPASDSAIDSQAAEFVRAKLEAIGFDALCMGLLDAINKGYAVAEILWQGTGNAIDISAIVLRDQPRFMFGENGDLRLKTLSNLLPGELLPEKKFIVHSIGSKTSSPYGLGLGSKLFWPVWFKRQGVTFWLTFLDKYGSPTAVGKYPTGTSEADQNKLLDALAAIAQDAGVTVPDGMVIELLQAARSGNSGYEDLCRYMDEQISYCILGEGEGAKSSGGAQASAAASRNEVRLEMVQYDSDMLSATLNQTLIKWLVEFNFPSATPPTVWRKVVQDEDIKLRAERDQILFGMGMRPDDSYREEYYSGWTFQADAPLPAVKDSLTTASFAEADAITQAQIANEDRLSQEASRPWSQVLAEVQAKVNRSTSLQSLRDDLLHSYAEIDIKDLTQVMTLAFAAAELAGMVDVKNAA